ncbi:efflux RND transporter permease subunit [Chitinolyticbacter albus]|uniref:efflux RND transporter permease subunit n=1 Tax=Chitinolyticbacter albus TaxID=2961951 RepID=UPI00210DEC93|nr:MMPL family transporter [Chitinolyticbacter albus]
MHRFAQFVVRHPWWVLLAVLLVTVAMLAGASKLTMRTDFDSELPASDPIVQTDNRFKAVFGDKDVIMLAVESRDVFSASTLNKIARLSEDLKQVDGVLEDEVTSLATVNSIKGNAEGVDVGRFMRKVPTDAAGLAALRRAAHADINIHGKLVAKDDTLTLVSANLAKGYDQAKAYAQVQALIKQYSGPEKIYAAGDPIATQEASLGIQGDLGKLMPLALLLVVVSFIITFRSVRGVVVPLGLTVLSIIWTLGFMGFAGLPMTMVSSTLPIIMIVTASSYGIHVVHRYYEALVETKDQKRAIELAIGSVGGLVIITGITSALGSIGLIAFKVVSIREFGVITSVAVLLSTAISLTFVPATLALFRAPKRLLSMEPKLSVLDRAIAAMVGFSFHHRIAVLVLTAVLMGVAAVGVTQIKVGNDFINTFPAGHPLRVAFEKMNDKLGGARYINVLADSGKAEGVTDPQFMSALYGFQQEAAKDSRVGYSVSAADIVAQMNKVMNEDDPKALRVPDDRDLISQFILLYSMSGDPGDFADRLDYDQQRAKIQVLLKTSDQEDHKAIYHALKADLESRLGPNQKAEFGGEVMFWSAVVDYIVEGKIDNILWTLPLVMLASLVVFRSVLGGIISVVPIAISTLLTFGVMGFTGIRLEMGTAIITSISVGIGVDFAIHFIGQVRQLRGRSANLGEATTQAGLSSGKAILFHVACNVLAFSAFMFSGFVPIQYFGWLVSLTLVTTYFATVIVLPALLSLLRPGFVDTGLAPQRPGPATAPAADPDFIDTPTLPLCPIPASN